MKQLLKAAKVGASDDTKTQIDAAILGLNVGGGFLADALEKWENNWFALA